MCLTPAQQHSSKQLSKQQLSRSSNHLASRPEQSALSRCHRSGLPSCPPSRAWLRNPTTHHKPYLVRAHTPKKRHEPAHEPLLSPNTHFKPHDQRRRETPNSPVILRLDPSLDMVAFP